MRGGKNLHPCIGKHWQYGLVSCFYFFLFLLFILSHYTVTSRSLQLYPFFLLHRSKKEKGQKDELLEQY